MAPKKNRIKVEQELQGEESCPPPAAMAPKKNRIKVEQELQGEESCPDRATPPPKPCMALSSPREQTLLNHPTSPGAARRQRQKKPKELRRVRWPVRKLQKGTELHLYTPFAPFVRLVKEITESYPSQVNRWTPEALLWLQDAAEFYLNETFNVELQLTTRHMLPSSSPLGVVPQQWLQLEGPVAGEARGGEHAGGSSEEAEEKPKGLVKRV